MHLPAPEMDQDAVFVAPRTALEEKLADMWRELLGVEEISVTANFFDLGGNSLMGATLVNRLQEQLGEYLYLIAVFDAPTIASLGQYLQENYPVGVAKLMGDEIPEGLEIASPEDRSASQFMQMSQKQPLVPIQPKGSKPPLFMPHAAGGMVFPYYNLIPFMPDQPVYGLQDPSSYHEETFYSSLEEMAEDYVKWIKKVQPTGPYRLAGWSFGGGLAFEIAQNLTRKGDDIALLVAIDTGMKPPDLRKNPGKRRDEMRAKRKKLSLKNIFSRISKIVGGLLSTLKEVMPYLRSGFYALLTKKTSGEEKKKASLKRWIGYAVLP